MNYIKIILSALIIQYATAVSIHENNINFRIDAGSRMCFYEQGKAGNSMEFFYQVLDGQHGDLDISVEVIDPNEAVIISDYKRTQNSILLDLSVDGDYSFCLDNTYSILNSKLVFVYLMIEPYEQPPKEDHKTIVDEKGNKRVVEEVLQWTGTDEDGEEYHMDVQEIADSLSYTLKHVVRARQLLDMYAALKSRDIYIAFEDILIVDVWSAFQITIMCFVGLLQVYVIKKLFSTKKY